MDWDFRDIRKIFEQRGKNGDQLPVIGYVGADGKFVPSEKATTKHTGNKVADRIGNAILTIFVAIVGIALNFTGRWW